MEKRKVFTLAIGIFWTVLALVSVLLMVSGRTTAAILGVIVICLSICTGILLPNPLSFIGLFAGIAMLILPPVFTGVILLVVCLAAMAANWIVWIRRTQVTP